MQDVVILGAGLAGLSAAHHLGRPAAVYEKEPAVGGHSRTKSVGGFLFDEGAHVFFGTDDCAREFVREPLGNALVSQRAEIWNHYEGRRFGRYPVQVNAHALDPTLAARCVLDFIAAERQPEKEVGNYEDWCLASFGETLAREFLLRYARKVWTVEPRELTLDWLGSKVGGRIARPALEDVVRGAIDPAPRELNYLTEFSYPASGGFQRIVEPLAARVPSVRVNCGVDRLEAGRRTIHFSDGSTTSYGLAICTLPLPDLVARSADAPPEVRSAADRLMWTSLRCVNLGLERADVGPGHWVYFYDHEIPFFRLSFPSRLSAGNAPPGMGSISCEIAYSRRRLLPADGLSDRVIASLLSVGILRDTDRIVVRDEVDVPYAYVVFDHQRVEAVRTIHGWMNEHGLIPCGRFGEWGYHWTFEAIESGRRAAAIARERLEHAVAP